MKIILIYFTCIIIQLNLTINIFQLNKQFSFAKLFFPIFQFNKGIDLFFNYFLINTNLFN